MRHRPNQAHVEVQGHLQIRISQKVYQENCQESTAKVKGDLFIYLLSSISKQ